MRKYVVATFSIFFAPLAAQAVLNCLEELHRESSKLRRAAGLNTSIEGYLQSPADCHRSVR